MFSFHGSPFSVPRSIREMCRATWHGLACAGSHWTGPERIAIAAWARDARLRRDPGRDRPVAAVADAIHVLAATPATTTRQWVDDTVAMLGEHKYVELTGIVARVVAIDTFTRLIGVEPEPLPEPIPGEPDAILSTRTARKGKAWVSMIGFPTPPNVLSLVPEAQTATNVTAEALYMTGDEMDDPDTVIDGLHRTQIETVATTVSHGNECFY